MKIRYRCLGAILCWWDSYRWKKHDFGPEMTITATRNGEVVSERRVRICQRCGATNAMSGGCHR